MKKEFFKLYVLIFFITSVGLSQNLKVTHYDLNLELLPKKHKLIAESVVNIKSIDSSLVNEIVFQLSYDIMESISDSLGNKIKFEESDGKLITYLKNPLKKNEILKLIFRYQGEFFGRVSNRIDEKNSWLLFESSYFPRIGNLESDNIATFNTKISVPDSITVVANGDLVSVDSSYNKLTYYYKTTKPIASFSICAANYLVQEQTINDIKIKTFLYPEHKDKNDTLVHLFGEVLKYYQKQFGKYPLSEFKIVETNRRGGYAPEGQMLINTNIINRIDFFGYFTIVHEVAHQWFPHMVRFYPEHYLNESFAQYASISYLESKGIMNENFDKLKKKLLFITLGFEGDYYELFRFRDHYVYEEKPLSEISIKDGRIYKWGAYYKGSFVLRSLASTLGEKTLNGFIKNLTENTNRGIISLDDFAQNLESTTQKELKSQVENWTNTNKIFDYELSRISNEKLTEGKYRVKVQVNNVGEIEVPFDLSVKTQSGKTIFCKVDSFYNSKAICEITTNEEVTEAEIDSKWFLLDANRINNFYPRKRNFSFLVSDYSITKEQYFYYPSATFGEKDKVRLGLWFSNIYPIAPEMLIKNAELIKFRTALFYSFKSKKIGYYIDFETFFGMPSYRWNWSVNLSKHRGAENYNLSLNYLFQKDENHFKHNILTLGINRYLIYDLDYYDYKDFEKEKKVTILLNWDRLFVGEKENITIKFGNKLLGSEYNFTKMYFELENFFPKFKNWFNYRIYGGIIRGNYPIQEAIHLSGAVYPSGFPYWFVDPGNKISTQKNLHIEGDANLRGYIGQHIKGENGFGINLDIPFPKLSFINLFMDLGNVWNKSFGTLKYNLGIGLNLKLLKIDFPFYINQPINNEKKFNFRWILEFRF